MNIIVLGPQGSGKGTQGKKLSEHLGVPHISTGALLRTAVREGHEHAQEIHEAMSSGALLQNDVLMKILQDRLAQHDCANGCILDGVPRDGEQAELLARVIDVDYVLFIDITPEESYRRINERARTEGRADDTPAILKQRLDTYAQETAPLIELYEEQGILIRIDGMQPIDDVFADVLAVLDK